MHNRATWEWKFNLRAALWQPLPTLFVSGAVLPRIVQVFTNCKHSTHSRKKSTLETLYSSVKNQPCPIDPSQREIIDYPSYSSLYTVFSPLELSREELFDDSKACIATSLFSMRIANHQRNDHQPIAMSKRIQSKSNYFVLCSASLPFIDDSNNRNESKNVSKIEFLIFFVLFF